MRGLSRCRTGRCHCLSPCRAWLRLNPGASSPRSSPFSARTDGWGSGRHGSALYLGLCWSGLGYFWNERPAFVASLSPPVGRTAVASFWGSTVSECCGEMGQLNVKGTASDSNSVCISIPQYFSLRQHWSMWAGGGTA